MHKQQLDLLNHLLGKEQPRFLLSIHSCSLVSLFDVLEEKHKPIDGR
jgi:hypothetical protein